MESARLRARCVHPAAKLAELRLLQGRIEAEHLLAGYEELPEATHALASLYLTRGEVAMAAAVVHRRRTWIGEDNVLAAPFLNLLVEIQLAQFDLPGAIATADRLEVADRSSPADRRHGGVSPVVASGAAGDPTAGWLLEAAITAFGIPGPRSRRRSRARLALAEAVGPDRPEVAIGEARTALAEFERLGAPREADGAAAFLRERGVTGRTGPKNIGTLTRREREVLGPP